MRITGTAETQAQDPSGARWRDERERVGGSSAWQIERSTFGGKKHKTALSSEQDKCDRRKAVLRRGSFTTLTFRYDDKKREPAQRILGQYRQCRDSDSE